MVKYFIGFTDCNDFLKFKVNQEISNDLFTYLEDYGRIRYNHHTGYIERWIDAKINKEWVKLTSYEIHTIETFEVSKKSSQIDELMKRDVKRRNYLTITFVRDNEKVIYKDLLIDDVWSDEDFIYFEENKKLRIDVKEGTMCGMDIISCSLKSY